jgi:Tol biopolymer transport system component
VSEQKELLRQGIEAARAGDKEGARKIFDEVLEEDPENVHAWLWLYRVVDSVDEKRICLTTVLQIDRGNERAQQALARLDARAAQIKGDEEIVPGLSRRQMTYIVAGGGGLIIVIILIIGVIIGGQGASQGAATREAQEVAQQQTDVAAAMTLTRAVEATEEAIAGTLAAEATFRVASPTPTATVTRSFALPTEIPPTETPTPVQLPTSLPPPQGVTGKIVGWNGRDQLSNDFLTIVVYDVARGGEFTVVTDDPGRYPVIYPTGQRVIYTRYFTTIFDYGLEAINVNGTMQEDIAQGWRGVESISRPEMPSLSADGNILTFVGVAGDTLTTEVYVYNLVGRTIERLTSDAVTYSWPAISPDGTRIAVVRNDVNSADNGEDIIVIDIASRAQTAITTDRATFVESAPKWSPDGVLLAYTAASANDPNNNDVFIRNADGTGVPTLPVRDPANERFPVFSPDGRYLAFSSNRTGFYDIFIHEFATGTLYQLTSTEVQDYPGGWAN